MANARSNRCWLALSRARSAQLVRPALAALAMLALVPALAVHADPAENPWPSFREPAAGPARAIGDYSAGCLQGAVTLPLDGVGYRVMRPSRHRYYGHPALISYLEGLGKRVRTAQLGVLLVGDLSQPRGGRAKSGHASHQTGLDADIWYTHPVSARKALSEREREELSAESMLDASGKAVSAKHRKHVAGVLREAVDDPRVDRVFVNPVIKRWLCEGPAEQRAWLRKIRPWHGHDDHFHVRLGCLPGDADCTPQAALPAGDGCDKLDFWFRQDSAGARKTAQKNYQKVVNEGRGYPAACEALLTPLSVPDEEPHPKQDEPHP